MRRSGSAGQERGGVSHIKSIHPACGIWARVGGSQQMGQGLVLCSEGLVVRQSANRGSKPARRVPPRPENINEIREALAQRRRSLSPSRFLDEEFEKFQRADARARKERQVTRSVIPVFQGHVNEDSQCIAGEIPLTNLDHLTDGSLVPGIPELYHGSRPEQLDRLVRLLLSHHIIPSTQDDLPILPSFFLAVKGPSGSLEVALHQAGYDAALGARGYHSLQSFMAGALVFDSKAYVITSIYHGGTLKMHACLPVLPSRPGPRIEYVMMHIRSYAVNSDADAFRAGAGAYRNGMDSSKRRRDEVIRLANEKAGAGSDSPAPSAFATSALAEDTERASQGTVTK